MPNKTKRKQPASLFTVLIEKAGSRGQPLQEINYIRGSSLFNHILKSLR